MFPTQERFTFGWKNARTCHLSGPPSILTLSGNAYKSCRLQQGRSSTFSAVVAMNPVSSPCLCIFSFVLPDTSRKSRQKTRVLRRTTDPAFNHTMVYDGISEVDLTEACVELTVWDRDRLASNLLGGLRLGAGTGKMPSYFVKNTITMMGFYRNWKAKMKGVW